jgi:hypothetical protein
VTGGGTLDRKSSSVGSGCIFGKVDSSASSRAGGRAIWEPREDEWDVERYLSVMKWSNTDIHPRPYDAVGYKAHKTMCKHVNTGLRSYDHSKLNASLLTRRKDTSLGTSGHPKTHWIWTHMELRELSLT